eukprot:TRINITY_DN38_c2_g1_i1.p1 TRINITY_DN38_c2_g1~~TRINITY_DN38_c2_g1_i1.p1  ORF type:complete len:464 (-),score=198.12 TRINITY_DN38_c2_g1_i1:23-1414(-)
MSEASFSRTTAMKPAIISKPDISKLDLTFKTFDDSFFERIAYQQPLPSVNLYTLATSIKNLVCLEGSLLAGQQYSKLNVFIPDLISKCLELGTKRLTKEQIAEKLDSLGVSLYFECGINRFHWQLYCLENNLKQSLEILHELLAYPIFPNEEVELIKNRLISDLEREKENSTTQANISFLRSIYPDLHPNNQFTTEKTIELVKQITSKDLQSFHEKIFGLNNCIIAVAGDVTPLAITNEFERIFKKYPVNKVTELDIQLKAFNKPMYTNQIQYITIPEKLAVDVKIGGPIRINSFHDDYWPLIIGCFTLGGSFSSRLSDYVRDNLGLTYGIYSYIGGCEGKYDGYWAIEASFSSELLSQGLESTLQETENWWQNGITEEELIISKATICGSFKVQSFSSNSAIVKVIKSIIERGYTIEEINNRLVKIQAVKLEEVNNAIKNHIDINNIVKVAAGSINKHGNSI